MLCCIAQILFRSKGLFSSCCPEIGLCCLPSLEIAFEILRPDPLASTWDNLSSRAPYRVALLETTSQLSCSLCQIPLPFPPFQLLLSRVLTYKGLYVNFSESGSQVTQPESSYLPIFLPLSLPYFLFTLPFSLPSALPLSSLPPTSLSFLSPSFTLSLRLHSFSPLLLSELLLHSLLTFLTLHSSGTWTIMAAPKWCLQLLSHHRCGLCCWYPSNMPFTRLKHISCGWYGCWLVTAHVCILLWRTALSQLEPSLLETPGRLCLTLFNNDCQMRGITVHSPCLKTGHTLWYSSCTRIPHGVRLKLDFSWNDILA